MIPFDVRLENFIDSVSFVADRDRQYIVWVKRSPKVSSVISLGELYSQFFDDNDIDNFIADELDMAPLTVEQRKAIRSFRDALNGFSKAPGRVITPISGAELIDDPEWIELVKRAKATLALFSDTSA